MTMGSCVSQCLQSSLHRYATSQHSEASQLIPDYSTGKVQPVSVTAEEIDATLEILKEQITKSQAVLAYLSRRETLQTELRSRRKTALERLGFSEEGAGPRQCWSNSENAEFGTRPSAVSTNLAPRNSHHLAFSCPILPHDSSLSAKSTQTESLASSFKDSFRTEMSLPSKPWQKEIQTDIQADKSHRYLHVPTLEFSQSSMKKEGNISPLSPFFYRNRSFSFISAINEGSALMANPEELECLVKAQSLTVEGNDVLWFRHPKQSIGTSTKDASYDTRSCSPHNLEKSGKQPAENIVCSQQPQCVNSTRVIKNSRSNISKSQTKHNEKKNTSSENIKNIPPPTSTAPKEHSATFSLVSSSTGICRALVHCASSKKTEENKEENHADKILPPPYREAPRTLGQDISKSSSSPRDTSPDGITTYDIQSNIPLSQRSRRRSLERQCSIPTDLATAFPRLLMLAAVSEQSEQLSSCEESDTQETGPDETGFPSNSTSKTEKR
ncbi:uncharacterized protein LOC111088283 [Limulus polyphemus]|uniref:Uncharacterized protein LOC111088283 n=1 Tax=Limulus polyphemus TaxID=6850 RepID=A0ABM1TCQ2_LIMPO|nr:uncharacterized protein LOC111088283 [Limulus polyphemus]